MQKIRIKWKAVQCYEITSLASGHAILLNPKKEDK